MTLTVQLFCLLLAAILFAVAALGVGSGRFNLIAAGLFFMAVAAMVP